jgi:hypothetical protein
MNKTLLHIMAFLRPLLASEHFGLFGFPIKCWYWFKYRTADRMPFARRAYWRDTTNIETLQGWFEHYYTYAADPAAGVIDHDNSQWEFFYRSGDCDDVAMFTAKKLATFDGVSGIKIILLARKDDATKGHFDCFYKVRQADNTVRHYLWNYGKPVAGTNVDDCVRNLATLWYAKEKEGKVIYTEYKQWRSGKLKIEN